MGVTEGLPVLLADDVCVVVRVRVVLGVEALEGVTEGVGEGEEEGVGVRLGVAVAL